MKKRRRVNNSAKVETTPAPATTPTATTPPPASASPRTPASGFGITVTGGGDAFSSIRRHWQVVLGAAVLGMLLAWIISAMQPRSYRASVLAAVSPLADTLDPSDVLRGVEVLEQRTVIATMAALAMTDGVIRQAAQGGAADGVSVNAAVLPNTNLVRVDVDAPDAARATAVASRIPALLGAQARSMYRLYGVTTVAPPSEADAVTPRSERAIIAGLLIGLIIGALIAYAMDRTRPSAATA